MFFLHIHYFIFILHGFTTSQLNNLLAQFVRLRSTDISEVQAWICHAFFPQLRCKSCFLVKWFSLHLILYSATVLIYVHTFIIWFVSHCLKFFFSFWQILKIAHENHTQHFTENNYNIYNDKMIFISIG